MQKIAVVTFGTLLSPVQPCKNIHTHVLFHEATKVLFHCDLQFGYSYDLHYDGNLKSTAKAVFISCHEGFMHIEVFIIKTLKQ